MLAVMTPGHSGAILGSSHSTRCLTRRREVSTMRWFRSGLTALAIAALVASALLTTLHERPATATPAAVAVGPPAGGSATTRVVLVVEENHEFGQIIGSRRAPFLNQLAAHGTLLTHYCLLYTSPSPRD